jgi:hypothetical protein
VLIVLLLQSPSLASAGAALWRARS